jgi:protein phosphatase 1 regulatory subunit 21
MFFVQDLEEFCTTWSDLVVFVERLTPLHQLSLQEESAQPSCGQKLSDRNNFLSSALPSVPSALAVLRDYLYLLTQSPPHHNEPALCDHLCRVVRIIHISVKGLMAAFSAKVTLEYQMPTISAKLKTTNECILSSLNGLCGVMDQLSSFVDVHGSALPSVRQAVKARSSEVDNEKTKNKSSADGGDILISLATSSEAIAEVTQVKNALERTLEEAQKRVITLEEEKEKLLVEFQLLKMKFERDQKPTSSRPGSGRSREEVDTSNLKEEEASVSEGELVQKHFAGRVAELSSQVQQSDSKVTFLDAECQSLQKQLVSCWKAKARLELDLEESSIMVSRLEDEIKTLSSNYENQISVMSDHLCSLNEQLMNKHEEPQPQRTAKVNLLPQQRMHVDSNFNFVLLLCFPAKEEEKLTIEDDFNLIFMCYVIIK